MKTWFPLLAAILVLLPSAVGAQTGYGTSYSGSSHASYRSSSYHDNTRDYFFFLLPPPVIVQTAPVATTAPVAPAPPAPSAVATLSPSVTESKLPAAINLEHVSAALGPSCIRCHGPDKHKGGVVLFNAAGAFEPKVSPKAIYDAVADDSMPQGGPPLSPQDKALLKQWSDGATRNVAPATPNVAPAPPVPPSAQKDDPVLQVLQDISRRLTVLEKAKSPVPVAPPPMPPATDLRK